MTKTEQIKAAILKLADAFLAGIFGLLDSPEGDRPDSPPPVVSEVWEPNFVEVPGVSFKSHGPFKTPTGNPFGLTVHHTVSGRSAASAKAVLSYLAKSGLGAVVMDENGVLYIPKGFNPLRQIVYHAGTSAWKGKTGVSNYCLGIEICGWGTDGAKRGAKDLRTVKAEENRKAGTYQAFTKAQEETLFNFCLWLKEKNPDFNFDWVVGHDEVAQPIGRKSDPGGSLSVTMPELRRLLKEAAAATLA